MELIYIYLGNVNGVEYDLGINLSQDKTVSYDKDTNKIEIQDRQRSTPEQFFAKNIVNITSLLGENGVGKSTILDILGLQRYHKKPKGWQYFLIYSGHDYFIEFENIEFEQDAKKRDNIMYRLQLNHSNIVTNLIDGVHFFNSKYYMLNCKYKVFRNDNSVKFHRYYTKSTALNIYKLLSSGEFKDYFFNKKTSNNFNVAFKTNPNISDLDTESYSIATEVDNYFFEQGQLLTDNKVHFKIITMQIIILQYYIHLTKNANPLVIKTLNRYINLLKIKNSKFDINEIIQTSIKFTDKYSDIFNSIITSTFNVLDSLPIDMFKSTETKLISNVTNKFPYINLNDNHYKSDIAKLLGHIDQNSNFELFEFNYGTYSAGEQALISMISQIHSIENTIENENQPNTKILLIDEFDQNLHPEWQRKYLNYLIEYFKSPDVDKGDTKYQIIFTTHSPFVVSDLPRENIIKLSVDKETGKRTASFAEKSFASNFYEIMSDSFFLEDSVGEFAKNKINHLIKMIDGIEEITEPKEIEYIQLSIQLIDDEFIRNHLESRLDEKITRESSIEDTERQIEALQAKLKKLKGEKEKGKLE